MALVTGIAVRIERSANGNQVFDSRVSLIRDGGASPFNFAASSPWATSDVVQSYGGNGELWGETWSASQINDETFGVILQVGSLGGFALARVDAMSIEVFYEADDCNR